MIRFSTLFITAFLCFAHPMASFTQGDTGSRVISFDEAIEISLSNNPQIQRSRAEIDISKAQLRATKSILYPQIETRFVLPFVESESGFFLDQLIWDFGRTGNDIKAGKFDVESEESGFDNTRSNVIRDTKIAYLEALIAKNRMETDQKAITSRELALEKTEQLAGAGLRTETELSETRLDLQQSILDYNDSKNEYRVAKLNLSKIMGSDITSDFEIEDNLDYDTNYLEKDELVELAVSSNHKIKSIVSKQAGLRARLSSSKSNFFPRVFGRVAYRLDGEGPDEPNFIAGIGIRVPIFKGFARFAEIDRSDAELRRNQAELSEVKKNIIFSVEELYLQLKNLEEKISITKKSKEIADKNLELAENRFDLQRASKIELADAVATKTESLANYENAIYSYKIAMIKLNNLLGE